jgi:hypothetical protein
LHWCGKANTYSMWSLELNSGMRLEIPTWMPTNNQNQPNQPNQPNLPVVGSTIGKSQSSLEFTFSFTATDTATAT